MRHALCRSLFAWALEIGPEVRRGRIDTRGGSQTALFLSLVLYDDRGITVADPGGAYPPQHGDLKVLGQVGRRHRGGDPACQD